MAQPLRRRTGRTAALVIAGGFGGTTLLLGVGGAVLSGSRAAVLPALLGYSLATLPLFLLAAIAVCRSEIWLLLKERVLHLLTFRPWRLQPRVEEGKVSEYAGVRLDPAPEDEGGGFLVSLITSGGEAVPNRQFQDQSEADTFAETVAGSVGLWFRAGGQQSEPVGG